MTRTGKVVAELEARVLQLEKAVELLGMEHGEEKELPKTTSADNGKVLGVVKGKWAKMKLPE